MEPDSIITNSGIKLPILEGGDYFLDDNLLIQEGGRKFFKGRKLRMPFKNPLKHKGNPFRNPFKKRSAGVIEARRKHKDTKKYRD